MNPDWDTDLNSRSYGIFIQSPATPRYISDGLSEVVGTRPGTFSEHDCTARSVLGDRPIAFGRGCCCGSLRDLCPRRRSRNCPGHTEYKAVNSAVLFYSFPRVAKLAAH